MLKIFNYRFHFFFLGIVFLGFMYLSWKSFFQPIQNIRQEYQQVIENQFKNDINIAKFSVEHAQKPSQENIIWIKTDSLCRMLEWTHAGFYLDSVQLKNLLNFSDKLFFTNENLYYAVNKKLHSQYIYAFIPVKIEYPVQNQTFKNFYYVGHFSHIKPETIIPGDSPDAIVVSNGKEAIFSILLADYESIRIHYKLYWIIFFTLFIFITLFLFYQYLSIYSEKTKIIIFSISIIFLRILLYYFNLPQSVYNSQLFSPEILALSNLNPSLGDFSINVLLIAWLLFSWNILLPHLQSKIQQLNSVVYHLSLILFSGLLCYLYYSFFSFSKLVFTNSRAFFDFTDIFDIQLYSLLIVINLAVILASFAWVGKSIFLTLWSDKKNNKILTVLIFIISWLLIVYINFSIEFFIIVSYPLFILGFIITEQIEKSNFYNKRIVSKMVEIFGLAFIVNIAIAESFTLSAEARVNQLARQLEMPRDAWLETLFPVLKEQWANLIQKGSKNPDKLLQQMVQKLNENLKLYPFAMAFINKKGEILASYNRETQLVPFENPLPTGISGLWTQPEPSSPLGWTYLAEFKHRYKIQLRIDPKPSYASSFYEKLIQSTDNNIPLNFSWAIYNKNNIIVQQSTEPFPAKIIDFETFKNNSESSYYVKTLSQNRVLLVKIPNRNFFSRLTSYSFLVYIFGLIFLIAFLPNSTHFIHFQSITYRIQMGFLFAAFIPMLLLWLFTQPLLKNYFLDDAQSRLKQDIEQIAAYLTREGIFNQQNEMIWKRSIGIELIQTLSQILTTDINIYDSTGSLIISTLPSVLPGTISAPLMNYRAFSNLQNLAQSHVIVEESIGKTHFFSGYIPIFNPAKKIAAYIHIPYLTRKDILDIQQRSFTAYLFNLYLILLLIIAAAGFLISRTATRPLEMLRNKLGSLGFGKENEKIEWYSQDEIGKLIQSYNSLIDLLSESEIKLAQTEREFAWREMAKQVAHEIKNPLTPMKLNIQHLMRVTADSENGEKIAKLGKSLLKQIDTLTDIANSFSNFARMPEGKLEKLSANDLFTDVYRLYEQTDEAEILLQIPEEIIYIMADKDQFSRVIINLVKNSLQSMSKFGKIVMKLEKCNEFAIFSIQDNGSGIPMEIQERIFEPNFSTKNSGMGLGLAMAKNIVLNHTGKIFFETSENQGTTFYVKIPLA